MKEEPEEDGLDEEENEETDKEFLDDFFKGSD